jgi:hypothetical protein
MFKGVFVWKEKWHENLNFFLFGLGEKIEKKMGVSFSSEPINFFFLSPNWKENKGENVGLYVY